METKKDRSGTARRFNNKCCDSNNFHIFFRIQSRESVQSDANMEVSLWEREKYWQLFTNTHDMDSVFDPCSIKKKSCRKN